MFYQQFTPDPRLAAHVQCLWHLRRPAGPASPPERILPDGCMELVCNRRTPFRQAMRDGTFQRQPAAMLIGQISTHVLLQADEAVEVLAVRFRHAGARAFFREDIDAFTDRAVELGSLGRNWNELAERVAEAPRVAQAVALLEGALLHRLGSVAPQAPRAAPALRLLHAAEPPATIGGIARALALSPRQLERIFRREVGLPPKHYARLLRFRRVLGSLEAGDPHWADVAAAAGYSDQAHLVREFRAFAGITPAAYFAGRTPFATALLG